MFYDQVDFGTTSTGSRGTSEDPCVWLDRMSTIFRSSYLQLKDGESHPCTAVLHSCLPLIVKVCYKFKHETRVVERSCRYVLRASTCNFYDFTSIDV